MIFMHPFRYNSNNILAESIAASDGQKLAMLLQEDIRLKDNALQNNNHAESRQTRSLSYNTKAHYTRETSSQICLQGEHNLGMILDEDKRFYWCYNLAPCELKNVRSSENEVRLSWRSGQ